MKTVIEYKETISRDEMLENIKSNGGNKAYFVIRTDWNRCGYGHLNNVVDDTVEDGYYLGDIDYQPVMLSPDKQYMFIETCVNDVVDYVNENSEINLLPFPDDDEGNLVFDAELFD